MPRTAACSPPGKEEATAAKREVVLKLPVAAMLTAVQSPAVRDADVVFIALHGAAGENGTIQAALDLAGKTYTGSGVLASAIAMNKAMTKRVFEREAIPTPHWVVLEAGVQGPQHRHQPARRLSAGRQAERRGLDRRAHAA